MMENKKKKKKEEEGEKEEEKQVISMPYKFALPRPSAERMVEANGSSRRLF